jgi:hypothetical protein
MVQEYLNDVAKLIIKDIESLFFKDKDYKKSNRNNNLLCLNLINKSDKEFFYKFLKNYIFNLTYSKSFEFINKTDNEINDNMDLSKVQFFVNKLNAIYSNDDLGLNYDYINNEKDNEILNLNIKIIESLFEKKEDNLFVNSLEYFLTNNDNDNDNDKYNDKDNYKDNDNEKFNNDTLKLLNRKIKRESKNESDNFNNNKDINIINNNNKSIILSNSEEEEDDNNNDNDDDNENIIKDIIFKQELIIRELLKNNFNLLQEQHI